MRISDWSSDVCSSDLHQQFHGGAPDAAATTRHDYRLAAQIRHLSLQQFLIGVPVSLLELEAHGQAIFGGSTSVANNGIVSLHRVCPVILVERSEEHTPALQSLMRHSYPVPYLTQPPYTQHP